MRPAPERLRCGNAVLIIDNGAFTFTAPRVRAFADASRRRLAIQGHAPHLDAPAFRSVWRRSRILEGAVEAEGAGLANRRVGIWPSSLRAGQPAGRIPLLDQQRFIS